MQRFKKYLLVAVGFALAGMLGASFGTNPSFQPISIYCGLPVAEAGATCNMLNATDDSPFVVPSGKRLVIESVSAYLDVTPNNDAISPIITLSTNGTAPSFIFIPAVPTLPPPSSNFIANLKTLAYADAGTQVTVSLDLYSTTAPSPVYATGHLENAE